MPPLIVEYALTDSDGLADDLLSRVEDHLTSCPDCLRKLRALQGALANGLALHGTSGGRGTWSSRR